MFNKLKKWTWDNLLFIESIFLLVFIPLYPKLPLLDVKNTWVYIRIEDFLVVAVLISFLALLVRKKVTLRSPLTMPILAFWLIGAIATIHGILLIFPTISAAYANVSFLSLVRHIEYLSLFFMAYQGMKDRGFLEVIITALTGTLIAVSLYGFGQKFLSFPAFLTMNEEFAKGTPIQLSQLSRVPSTFAGHYDLAAYLVLIIPMMVSLFFGFKNYLAKAVMLIASLMGFVLLFMTVSRVSLFVLFIGLAIVVFFQKKKLILISIPALAILTLLVVTLQPSILNRFKSTLKETDVVVDAKTGSSLGHVNFVPKEYFKDKIVLQRSVGSRDELTQVITGQDQNTQVYSSASAILPYKFIPQKAPLVTAINVSNGENLPQGTEYINLTLSPVTQRLGSFYYELPPNLKLGSVSAQVIVLHGDFIVKRAAAYDLSFTTRTQGEWPHAIAAFMRNIFIGSGYGSVSLAVDNNYLRILGEIGILGFISFFGLFLCLGIYIKRIFRDIDSPLAKSFVLGFSAGLVGLLLNAVLIDVFEASKIAFVLWILMGFTFGILSFYKKSEINLLNELRGVATSSYAIITSFFLFCIVLFSGTLDNYFVGDDFAWLRWVADCTNNCSPVGRVISYFTQADGFFYRPGTKVYFYIMHSAFWLNQSMYHLVSLLLHFLVVSAFYFLAKKILDNKLLAFLSSIVFLALSGYSEVVFWISSIGYLFNALFGLLGLIFFISWNEKRRKIYLVLSLASISFALTFHEMGVVFPLLIFAYLLFKEGFLGLRNAIRRADVLVFFVPVLIYLILRFLAQSHWSGGDYSYNLIKLPFNFAGNIFGYGFLTLLGTVFLPIYEKIRLISRMHPIVFVPLISLIIIIILAASRIARKSISLKEQRVIIFSSLLFLIPLLPFLGLGNIASRYSYLSSMGFALIFAVFAVRLYDYLKSQGREIALGFTSLFVMIFILFHIIQIQQASYEWSAAGSQVQNFLVSMEASYSDSWSSKNVEFHFVNVPQKVGGAWVFPVGLDHAVWFAFKNPNAKIFIHNDLSSAIKDAGYYRSNIVLVFDSNGNVTQYDRFKGVPPNLIIPSR